MDVTELVAGSVVVGVGGGGDAERSLRWAAREASLRGRRLVVLHLDPDRAAPARSWVSPELEAAAQVRRWVPDLEVHALRLSADVRSTLVDVTRRAHLLVLGSRGRGLLRSIVLGSVSSTVTGRASGPVVVVRPGPEHHAASRVVVGVDGTPGSVPVTEFAFRHASWHGRPLTVVHCYVDAALAADLRSHPTPTDAEELRATLAECVAGLSEKYPDVEVTASLEPGPVDACLTRDPAGSELLVIGSRLVDSGLRMLTGSMATAVLCSAHTAVAVVPQVPTLTRQPHGGTS